ncbi:hypothetical protein AQUSIP_24680 [Aquicella siphonis]|uniref:Uncharacterized protein n=1 Tax=Aquicella siphonis TaxID=254247 RepID=A0A5E4PL51_9COXI|nr:hypothetical protein [Aquicella siphonis]VVC77141.1 hypothetical protein AQUSIP_24680 [Aquicella siphonis]
MLEGSTLFNSLYLSIDPVQTEKKDGGGLVSCGPISVEFVKHVQCHPEVLQKLPVVTTDEEWVETIPVTRVSLHELGILPGNLGSLLTDEPRYIPNVEAIRLSHCQELGRLPDDQFNLANEGAQLGFDKDSHKKLQEWEDELNPPEPADDSLLQDFEEDIQSREIRDKQSSDAAPRDEPVSVQPASSYSGNRAVFFQPPQTSARSSVDPELTQQEALQRINNVVTTLNDISDRLLESLNSINRNLSRLSILNEMSINKKREEHASFDLSSHDSYRKAF